MENVTIIGLAPQLFADHGHALPKRRSSARTNYRPRRFPPVKQFNAVTL